MTTMEAPKITSTSTPAAVAIGQPPAPAPAAPAPGALSLSQRAMLVDLDVSEWNVRRSDKDAAREIAQLHGASEDWGAYIKRLLPQEALARLNSALGAAKREHERRTLAWDRGRRILSNVGYLEYVAAMRQHASHVEDAREDVLAHLDDHINEASRRLNTLFKRSDYPSVAELRARIGIRWRFEPIPTGDDFRVTWPTDALASETARIRADIEAAATENLEGTKREIGERVKEVVGHLANRLREYGAAEAEGDTGKRLYQNMVDNVRDLAMLLPSLNMAADPLIDQLATELRTVTRFSADTLKSSPAARETTERAAADILAKMDDYI